MIFELANLWSSIMFVVLFITSAGWFWFYKVASHVYLLMPSTSTAEGEDAMYVLFNWVFLSTLACKTLAILLRIVEQSRADVFIMDWEHLASGRNEREDKASEAHREEAGFLDVYGED